ncbi:hypothetical protein IQ238_13475 [Pleurocapsales cyanobacterium LEGE 06147]|nr:hypothetical protein [Pleurocapsales cyanobacterium LEGE 06147]
MNRFKLLLVLLILVVLSLLFVQNQEPLSLRLFCAEVNQSCLYQTPQLPLALWLFSFTLAGVLTSLIWQLFNRFGYPAAKKRELSEPANFNYEPENASGFEPERRNIYEERRSPLESNRQPSPSVFENNNVTRSDWEDSQNDNDWNIEQPSSVTIKDTRTTSQIGQEKSYEMNQEPTSVASDRSQEKKEEPKIYDANYRMINPPYKSVKDSENTKDEDDEDWI